MEYRILKENEIKEAIELVARVAKKDIYKDFDQEGINSFNQVNCDTFYRNKQNLTYICLENKKIINKKERRKNRNSTKSHNTCPKDRKCYYILKYTQNKLIRTNFSTTPSFSARCRTS